MKRERLMAYTTTRAERADRSQFMQAFLAAATCHHLRHCSRCRCPPSPRSKPPPRAISRPPRQVGGQPHALPHRQPGRPAQRPVAAGARQQRRAGHRGAAATADSATMPVSATLPGAGARTLVNGSVKLVRPRLPRASCPAGRTTAQLQPLSDAFAGFSTGKPKIEMFEGRTADGATHLLYASIGDGKAKHSYWWFMPLDQPEGWFDENGKRLGGTVLGEPKPGARISSPFGTRHYYGRSDRRRLPRRHRLRGQDRRADLCGGRRRDQPRGLVLQLRPHGEDHPRRQLRDPVRPHVPLRDRASRSAATSTRAT